MCMHMQKNLTLKVDEELVEKAHRYGINISKFLEFALDNAFRHGFENLSQTQEKALPPCALSLPVLFSPDPR